MISERTFSHEFTAFWANCLPFLNSQVIAELNLGGSLLAEGRKDWVRPLQSTGDSSNNAVVAETAFGLFVHSLSTKVSVLTLSRDQELFGGLESAAINRVSDLGGDRVPTARRLGNKRSEAVELARRLESYFSNASPGQIVVQPRFRGCGFLDSCYGDLLFEKDLFELKMVDRNLRSADLRQVLIYCALNYQSRQYEIDAVTILNPRRGVEFNFGIEELAERTSGKSPTELYHQITEFMVEFESMHMAS